MFVHLAFLTGFGNRLTTMMKWLRSMIGRGRAEREFSTAHTGGDLSLPDQVRRRSSRHPSRWWSGRTAAGARPDGGPTPTGRPGRAVVTGRRGPGDPAIAPTSHRLEGEA